METRPEVVTDPSKKARSGPRYVPVSEKGKRCGETHPKAKLSDAQVDAMRDEYENGLEGLGPRIGYRALARKYGTTKSTVRGILDYSRRALYTVRFNRITKD